MNCENETSKTIRRRILDEILAERTRQDELWGVQHHDLPIWHVILVEEVGEAAMCILGARNMKGDPHGGDLSAVREEYIQIAAVALSVIEAIDAERTEAGEWLPGSFKNARSIEEVEGAQTDAATA